MCAFFSLCSAGDGKPLYFDAKLRKKLKNKYESPDSHTSIADYFGYKAEKEDILNKYEYNPITKVFTVDQKNNPVDDSEKIKKFCLEFDFKTIIPRLNIHPIIYPFKDISTTEICNKDLLLLKNWASVWASVWDSVRDSVRASVWDSVGDSVWASVGDSVWASVWDSVRASVRASVWASVRAYISSFFTLDKWKYIKHPKGKNPFQPCIDLWNKGLVPSYDGSVWRLHGKDGKVLWTGKIEGIK